MMNRKRVVVSQYRVGEKLEYRVFHKGSRGELTWNHASDDFRLNRAITRALEQSWLHRQLASVSQKELGRSMKTQDDIEKLMVERFEADNGVGSWKTANEKQKAPWISRFEAMWRAVQFQAQSSERSA